MLMLKTTELNATEMFDVSAAPASPPGSVRLFGLAQEVFRIQSRALSVAQAYETLRVASDPLLARQGLRRSDLPRAAYRMLTDGFGTGR
jgi:hypothetical protein